MQKKGNVSDTGREDIEEVKRANILDICRTNTKKTDEINALDTGRVDIKEVNRADALDISKTDIKKANKPDIDRAEKSKNSSIAVKNPDIVAENLDIRDNSQKPMAVR